MFLYLEIDEMSFILIPLFAFFYRCRGGFISLGHTTLARLVWWALPVALYFTYLHWQIGWLCGVMAFVGLMIPHAKYQSAASIHNTIMMGLIGAARMLLILSPLAYFQPLILAVAPLAILQGEAYFAGWTWLNGRDITIAKGGSEWGELLTGAVFGFCFALVNWLV